MAEEYVDRLIDQRLSVDADQAEFSAILRGQATADAGVYDDRVAGAMDDFSHQEDEAVGPDWQRRDLESDDAVGGVLEEVERRVGLLGPLYPFDLADGQMTYRASGTGIYEFCLAASVQKDLTSLPFAEIVRAFERVSAILIERVLGTGLDPLAVGSLHVGAPRDANVGVRFDEAMASLADATGEWWWAPEEDLPDDKAGGDEGLDFVVWKALGDGRQGKLFIAGQSACGNDWDTKLKDLDFDRLRKWFHPMTRVDPVRAFTTPYVLSDGNIIEAQRRAGLVFDRVRLTALAEQLPAYPSLGGWLPRLAGLRDLVIRTP